MLVAPIVMLFCASVIAGAQNQLAGGGSFVTLAALMFVGLDARAANITSTVALFPGQIAGGWMARHLAGGVERLSFRALVGLSLIGGGAGALLLLLTPTRVFERLVPWLVLFATAAFAGGTLRDRLDESAVRIGPRAAGAIQFCIAVYGGYFGGGIGILMLAALTLAGMPVANAGATKNVLAGAMNATAVAIFLASRQVRWLAAAVVCAGALLGSVIGAHLIQRIDARLLRAAVILIGVLLTAALFRN